MFKFLLKDIEGGFLKSAYLFILLVLLIIIIYVIIRVNKLSNTTQKWNSEESSIKTRLQRKNFSEPEIIKYVKVYYLVNLVLFIFYFFGFLIFKYNLLSYIIIPALIPSFILKSFEKSVEKNHSQRKQDL